MKEGVERIIRLCKDVLFPIYCISCHQEGAWFCPSCFSEIHDFGVFLCPYCSQHSVYGVSCVSCMSSASNIVSSVISMLPYHTASMERLLHVYKYQYATDCVDVFYLIIRSFFDRYPFLCSGIDICVPVPLHRQRQLERGFNQSELFAQYIASLLHLPMKDVLIRNKKTTQQALLSKADRISNVSDAFVCSLSSVSFVKGKKILLIDDVYTTGSTLQAAAEALFIAGAKDVQGCTIFRGV